TNTICATKMALIMMPSGGRRAFRCTGFLLCAGVVSVGISPRLSRCLDLVVGPHVPCRQRSVRTCLRRLARGPTAAVEDRAALVLLLFTSVLVWQLPGSFYWTALPAFLPPARGRGSPSTAGLRSPSSYSCLFRWCGAAC